MKADAIIEIIQLCLEIGASVLEVIRTSKNPGEIKLKDLPGWKIWEKQSFKPNYSAILEELRKRRKK